MLVIAFIVSSALAGARAKKENINPDMIFNLLFTGFIFGIVGARLFYVIDNISYYSKNPHEIIMFQHGGLSWFGGLILGVISALVYLKSKKVSILRTLDLIIPFVALAEAIGRIGCLLNGCCYGKVSEKFGIYFDVHQQVLIPTQAYSSLSLIIIFIGLRFLQEKPHRLGEIFCAYLLLYSIKRFIIEYWRADNPIVFSCLTLFQILSMAMFITAIVMLVIIKKSASISNKS